MSPSPPAGADHEADEDATRPSSAPKRARTTAPDKATLTLQPLGSPPTDALRGGPTDTLLLEGHQRSVTSLAYHASGTALATASTDGTCLIWAVVPTTLPALRGDHGADLPVPYDDDDDDDPHSDSFDSSAHQAFLLREYSAAHHVTSPHTLPVCHDAYYLHAHSLPAQRRAMLDVAWVPHHDSLVTAGADHTVQVHRVRPAGGTTRLRTHRHEGIVNAVAATRDTHASASDDGTVRLWDLRQTRPVAVIQSPLATNTPLPWTAVALDDTLLMVGGLDGAVMIWDRAMLPSSSSSHTTTPLTLDTLQGHTDTITSLALHPQGTHLLSQSMDGTLRVWDVRPYVEHGRSVGVLRGSVPAASGPLLRCAWNAQGTMVAGGSADRYVHVWDTAHLLETRQNNNNMKMMGRELYALPGHKGCVNAVAFHPVLPNVLASGAADHHVLVGELT